MGLGNNKMKVEKVKWFNNADSPVIFMIDDLANVWIDINRNGKVDLGEDWGYAADGKNSSFNFLNEVILRDFPNVKTTFFVPLDRKPIIADHKFNAHFGPVNETPKLKSFFKSIHTTIIQFVIFLHIVLKKFKEIVILFI